MRNRVSSTHVIAALLFVTACVLGAWAQYKKVPQVEIPRARFHDATPLGGKGLRLMLERLGYTVKREDGGLQSMPAGARVWILIDPHAGFSKREAENLLKWIKKGGTLIWALPQVERPPGIPANGNYNSSLMHNYGLSRLQNEFRIFLTTNDSFASNDEPLPSLSPIDQSSISNYWHGVKKANGSDGGFIVTRPCVELSSSQWSSHLVAIDYGKGRVFIAPDALLFTNYALSKPDNAILVTNLIRVHVPSGTVYFDERNHGEDLQAPVTPNLLYYLWRPPLRYALLQLLVAALLLWAFYGRRLGTPVPLPDGGPVTRASLYAAAMGALFQKVHRPRAASAIIGENFRRQLTRRLGLSITDPDELIAQRAAAATGYSSRIIDRLLLQAKTPDSDEARSLHDAQEMETILRSFEKR